MTDTSFDPFSVRSLADWRGRFPSARSIGNYVDHHVSTADAVAFASLVAPRFVDVEGCLLRRDAFREENFRSGVEHFEGRTQDVERIVNHHSLWDSFSPADESEERALEWMAQVVADGWAAAAQRQFPELEVRTEVFEEYGPTVTLWSERRPAPAGRSADD